MLLVGLGNPDPQYLATRHNAGFLFLDSVCDAGKTVDEHETPYCWWAELRLGRHRLALGKPLQYMNLSGPPVVGLLRSFKLTPDDLIVAHDDKDLAFGRIQVRKGGGDAGHKGIRSIIEALGTADFIRFRLGIGADDSAETSDYVLDEFSKNEDELLSEFWKRGLEALRLTLNRGHVTAMNHTNALPPLMGGVEDTETDGE